MSDLLFSIPVFQLFKALTKLQPANSWFLQGLFSSAFIYQGKYNHLACYYITFIVQHYQKLFFDSIVAFKLKSIVFSLTYITFSTSIALKHNYFGNLLLDSNKYFDNSTFEQINAVQLITFISWKFSTEFRLTLIFRHEVIFEMWHRYWMIYLLFNFQLLNFQPAFEYSRVACIQICWFIFKYY